MKKLGMWEFCPSIRFTTLIYWWFTDFDLQRTLQIKVNLALLDKGMILSVKP
jgi:hypothetical protein